MQLIGAKMAQTKVMGEREAQPLRVLVAIAIEFAGDAVVLDVRMEIADQQIAGLLGLAVFWWGVDSDGRIRTSTK